MERVQLEGYEPEEPSHVDIAFIEAWRHYVKMKTHNHSGAQRQFFQTLHYDELFHKRLDITSSPRDSELKIALNNVSGSEVSDLSDSSESSVEIIPTKPTKS